VVQDKIDRNVLKFPEAPQESMAVDADPFPVVDVNTTPIDFSSLMPKKKIYVLKLISPRSIYCKSFVHRKNS
jgi:hypothetical protein